MKDRSLLFTAALVVLLWPAIATYGFWFGSLAALSIWACFVLLFRLVVDL